MNLRFLPWVLLALLALVQAQIWFGRGGLPHVMGLRAELARQTQTNEQLRAANAALAAEVSDLREGLEGVEEKARHDLGLIRSGETLVKWQAAPAHAASGAAPSPAQAAKPSR